MGKSLLLFRRFQRDQMNLGPCTQTHGQPGRAHAVADQNIHSVFMIPPGEEPIPIIAGGFDRMPEQRHLPAVGVAA